MADVDPSTIEVRVGSLPRFDSEPTAVGKQIVSTPSATTCVNDMALVILDRSLDELPILPIRLTRPTFRGETATVVGYGEATWSSTGLDPRTVHAASARFRREAVPVLEVGPNRFDSIGGPSARGTLWLGPGPCHGDSGGPAIAEETGAVIGVAAIANWGCLDNNFSVYTQAAEFYDMVLDGFALAGAEPWIEGEAAPMSSVAPSDPGCSIAVHPERRGASQFWLALITMLTMAIRARRQANPYRDTTRAVPN